MTACKTVQLRGMNEPKPTLTVAAEPVEVGDHIPEANPSMDAAPEAPPLFIGEPFAISHACDLLTAEEGAPGCACVVRCDCGQVFKFSLLAAGPKRCPSCRTPYTHLLLIAPADDTEIVGEAMAQVLNANGYSVPDFEGDDDDDEEEDEEDEEDEDGAK